MTPTPRLYDCGTGAVSSSWGGRADATSGVSIARWVRTDTPGTWRADNSQFQPSTKPPAGPHAYGASGLGKLGIALKEPRASHIVFVVRDDAGRSDVLYQTSDETWQAYNRYGGASTYGGPGRRREPRVLQRERGVLENAMGAEHRQLALAVPDARLLQGDARPVR